MPAARAAGDRFFFVRDLAEALALAADLAAFSELVAACFKAAWARAARVGDGVQESRLPAAMASRPMA